jgi:hypothetical protein
MGVLHATIDAALQLRSKDKVAAGQIGRIDIDMPQTEGCGPIRRSAGELPPHWQTAPDPSRRLRTHAGPATGRNHRRGPRHLT